MMTTPIERFKQAVESMDMECHWIGRIAQEVGPDLLALVEAVDRLVAFEDKYDGFVEGNDKIWDPIRDALAKLNGETDE